MERRIYHGTISPAALADFLVGHYDPQNNVQAQTIRQGETNVVQIGQGDVPTDLRHAITIAITETASEGEPGIAVTMGQHQWLTPQMATYAAVMGLISVLVTPWALFGLLWPITEAVGAAHLPGDIWSAIDAYVITQGGHLATTEELSHPHSLVSVGDR